MPWTIKQKSHHEFFNFLLNARRSPQPSVHGFGKWFPFSSISPQETKQTTPSKTTWHCHLTAQGGERKKKPNRARKLSAALGGSSGKRITCLSDCSVPAVRHSSDPNKVTLALTRRGWGSTHRRSKRRFPKHTHTHTESKPNKEGYTFILISCVTPRRQCMSPVLNEMGGYSGC